MAAAMKGIGIEKAGSVGRLNILALSYSAKPTKEHLPLPFPSLFAPGWMSLDLRLLQRAGDVKDVRFLTSVK